MADIKSPSIHKPVYVGTHGNQSFASASYTLAGVASGDKVRMLKMPIGTSINSVRLHHEALGTGVTVAIALRDKAGNETTLAAAKTSTTAGSLQTIFKPVYVGDIGPSELVAVIGGGTANGEITVQAELVATGY